MDRSTIPVNDNDIIGNMFTLIITNSKLLEM
jgi:hypothetical protein